MKYNTKEFAKAVNYYKKELPKKLKGKTILIYFQLRNEKQFYSIAPLSRAVHELNGDLVVSIKSKNEFKSIEALFRVWDTFDERKKGVKSEKTKALSEFIESVNKKVKNKKFEEVFERPYLIFTAGKKGFESENSVLEYNAKWFRKYRWEALVKTAKAVWKNSYDLKKNETASVGFELIPKKKDLDLPFEDYLDSYAIANAMFLVGKKMCKSVSMGTYTGRWKMTEPMNKIADLRATLVGCEYEKHIAEIYFKKYKKLSKLLKLNYFKPVKAGFGIHGKGYSGKHFFGDYIGYPSPNLKTRWNSPGSMFLKPSWLVQTKIDTRMPQTRYAITSTLPIPNFIRTCDIDYKKMREKNEKIKKIIEKCDVLFVKGKKRIKGYVTDLEVDLSEIRKKKAFVWKSDSDVRKILNLGAKKAYGVKAGMYGNCPGGEAFFTPYKINGIAVSDVVISIDQSYVIPENNPLVIKFTNGTYKVLSGPKNIISKMIEKRKEAKKRIADYKKSKSLPASLIKSYERNFMQTGEFAINTNPKARLSRYLIETEKIAKMMHIALGSGYEPDRETLYHWDTVINNPRQKMDIYGISKGKKHWILKNGQFVI